MLTLPTNARIYLMVPPVDMRKSFDGLCAAVAEVMQLNPLQVRIPAIVNTESGDRERG